MDKAREDEIMKELGYDIRVKPITTPSKTPSIPQGRDTFETPNYAIDLLIPFIPENIGIIWEPACGSGKIVHRLEWYDYKVIATDIRDFGYNYIYNFIEDMGEQFEDDLVTGHSAIITNPPFSIKEQFIERAFSYKVPFAFLINADYSGQNIKWVERGCEKIIPTRRIAYITPNIIQRVHEGEIWELRKSDFPEYIKKGYKKFSEAYPKMWEALLDKHHDYHNYPDKETIPQELLYKYSSAQFHSMWITWGFGLGQTETFVDLPIKELKENI